ncbi:MAG: NAD-dependent dehydratase [Deltaproteobacteria bacterium]|nr:MAG: NAD-dependent dehydratase [Deltaproteobacteria bacterium]
MKDTYVVCGSTGNVGSRVARSLLEAGEAVRVIARDRVRLGPLAAKGAEPFPGELGDTDFLARAFQGSRAVFALIPPKYDAVDFRSYQDGIGESIASALFKARVPRVVTLSSVGAHLSRGTGPILGLHDFEGKLAALRDTEVVHLRAGYFMENHLWSIPVIRGNGIQGSPLRPDVAVPMVATKDIGAEAARRMCADPSRGHRVEYLLGPRDVTMADAAGILGRAIGIPDLAYVRFPEEDARRAMAGIGMSKSVVEAMLEMYRGFNAGTIRPTRERNGSAATPTTLEEFAKSVFAPSYRAAA